MIIIKKLLKSVCMHENMPFLTFAWLTNNAKLAAFLANFKYPKLPSNIVKLKKEFLWLKLQRGNGTGQVEAILRKAWTLDT